MKSTTKARCIKLIVPAALLSTIMATGAGAVQSPPGCNANTLALTLSRSSAVAVPGQSVSFGVSVAVPATDGAGVPACDTSNVTITAQCPDADNNVPPTTPVVTLATGQSYPAGTAPTSVGSIDCTMPVVPVNKAISAYSAASGLLLDTELLPGSEFTRSNTLTVTVTPCQVKVDKQVSCDGGTTWVDPGLVLNNEDGTLDCKVIGLSGPVKVRYQASNSSTSCLLTECVLTESNPSFGTPPAVGTLTPGQTTDFLPAPNSPACSTAYGDPQNPKEPNTATITCQTGGTPVTASDLSAFSCLKVDATVDRAVNCGEGYNDQTMVRANEDGTNGCTAMNGANVNWQYDACNDGTAPLYDCVLVDDNLLVSEPILVGNLAAGACAQDLPATKNPVPCSDELEASEAPDKGKVTLTCCTNDVSSIIDCSEANRVIVYDVSTVTCNPLIPPPLTAKKECVDTNADGIDDNVRVVASAGAGDVNLINCVATDTIYRTSACPATGDGTAIPLTPEGTVTSPFTLAPNTSQALFGTIDPALTQSACNTATVNCQVAGTLEPVTAIADPVTCNFRQGCLTRTPGFWGTHPAITDKYLDVQVCGTTIDNTNVGSATSAIEAICSTGTDMKIQGQQLTQLIRQCTAAALNISATLAEGGNCSSDPSVARMFDACCDASSACTGADTGLSVNECIYLVDEFNNSMDTFYPASFKKPGPATPYKCQGAKGNGKVVYPTTAP